MSGYAETIRDGVNGRICPNLIQDGIGIRAIAGGIGTLTSYNVCKSSEKEQKTTKKHHDGTN